jgi:hypothetical protein
LVGVINFFDRKERFTQLEKKLNTKELVAAAALSVMVTGQATTAHGQTLQISKRSPQQIERRFEAICISCNIIDRFSDGDGDGDDGSNSDGNNYKNPNDDNESRTLGSLRL